jgi:hypothetical protein
MTYDRTLMKAKYFDRQRKRSLGEVAKLLLLRTSRDDDSADKWEVLHTVETGWSADFSERFELPTFNVAREDDEFGQMITDASQVVVIDSDKPALNGKIHEIVRAHTIPAGVAPYHRIRAEHKGSIYTA